MIHQPRPHPQQLQDRGAGFPGTRSIPKQQAAIPPNPPRSLQSQCLGFGQGRLDEVASAGSTSPCSSCGHCHAAHREQIGYDPDSVGRADAAPPAAQARAARQNPTVWRYASACRPSYCKCIIFGKYHNHQKEEGKDGDPLLHLRAMMNTSIECQALPKPIKHRKFRGATQFQVRLKRHLWPIIYLAA